MGRNKKPRKLSKSSTEKYEIRPRTGIMSSLGEAITQGFGFGSGNAIAHRIFGPNQVKIEEKTEELCTKELQIYRECNKNTSFDCDEYFEKYKKCVNGW